MSDSEEKAPSKALGRAELFAPRRPRVERVEVPEWGGHVFVRAISGRERDEFEASLMKGEEPDHRNVSARFVTLCLCDEQGRRLLPDDDDAGQVGDQDAAGLGRVFRAAERLNGMGRHAREEARKN